MISKYISYDEAVHTNHNLPNTPNSQQLENITYLAVNLLDYIREHFDAQIILNSCFRSSSVNIAIGGSPTSEHMANGFSAAADIGKCGDDLMKVYEFIRDNLNYNQIILEEVDDIENPTKMRWLHVSLSQKKNKRQILLMKNKKYYPWR